MRISVNGSEQQLEAAPTVAELLALNKVSAPDMVSVQLNGEFVRKEAYAGTRLAEGDEVEFLYFMGGGTLA